MVLADLPAPCLIDTVRRSDLPVDEDIPWYRLLDKTYRFVEAMAPCDNIPHR